MARGHIEMQFQPWTAPSFVRPAGDGTERSREDGFPIKAMTQESLDDQVYDWLESVYTKAEKPNPWTRPLK